MNYGIIQHLNKEEQSDELRLKEVVMFHKSIVGQIFLRTKW